MSDEVGGLLQAAEQAERPGLPIGDFRITRRAGDRLPVLLGADGRLVLRPESRIQRASACPLGRTVALEVADDGTEQGRLLLLDVASGRSHDLPHVRLRYADQVWTADGTELLVTDTPGRLLAVDATTTAVRVVDRPAPGARPIRWADRILLVEAVDGAGSRLLDPTGAELARLPRVRSVTTAGPIALAVTTEDLRLLEYADGQVGTLAARVLDGDADGVPVHAVATPDGACLHVVREGWSELVELDRGLVEVRRTPLSTADDVRTITGLTWHDRATWVRVEGPALPPDVSPVITPVPGFVTTPGRNRSRLVSVPADDGATIDVVLTGDATGPAPTLLEVYGGFGVVEVPSYEPSVTAWCALGGLHATARIRGGGGRGSRWHEQGRAAAKGRAVADAVAVARGLVERGLTRPELLVLAGASHGGLVAAAAALAEPGLVAGAACTAAPLDPHRIAEHPLGDRWHDEFGDLTDPQVRAAMDDYSPLARAERYPADAPFPRFLLTTFEHDTRVAPAATDRLAAVLTSRGAPVDRVRRPRMGHGGNPLDDVHDFAASILRFALDCTGAS